MACPACDTAYILSLARLSLLLFVLHHFSPPSSRLLASASAAIVPGSTLHTPVEDVVILVPLADEEVTKERAQITRFAVKAQSTTRKVVEIDAELVGDVASASTDPVHHEDDDTGKAKFCDIPCNNADQHTTL